MDRFSAHIDRSWDLVSKGEINAALVAARQALVIDDEAPEVHNLIGYIHALEGDFEDALNAYQKAIDLDEWYLEPLLNAAELQVHPDADPNEAIRLCRRASQMVLSPEEHADAALIEVDALLNTGRKSEAVERLNTLDNIEDLPPVYQTAIVRFLFESGDLDSAQIIAKRLLDIDENISDAWYCLGLIARETGRRIDAVKAFIQTRKCDLLLPRAPWHETDEQLKQLLMLIIQKLPNEHAATLMDTEIIITDYPSQEQIATEMDPRLAVFAQGIDTSRSAFSKLWVFSLNLERIVMPTALEDDLKKLLIQEIVGEPK